MAYISFTCKNIKLWTKKDGRGRIIEHHPDYCDRAFMDKDITNVTTYSPTWKYCPDCVAKGFTNPDKKPLSEGKRKHYDRLKELNKKKREAI
jgi:hypothetical protein